jgi:cell division septal protein FtsQ
MVAGPKISTPKTRAQKSRRYALTPLQKQLVVGVILFLTLSLLISAIWYVTRLTVFQIERVEVVGGFTISHDAIKAVVEQELQGKYFALIPKRFVYLYPEERITTLLTTFPRLKEVRLERDGRTVIVTFTEYEPYALWCREMQDEQCLFIDNQGYAFSQAPQLSGNALIRFLKDTDEPQLGQSVFPSEFLREARIFVEDVETGLGLFITHIHAKGTYDLELTLAGGGLIKISQTKSFTDSYQNFKNNPRI